MLEAGAVFDLISSSYGMCCSVEGSGIDHGSLMLILYSFTQAEILSVVSLT